MKVRDVKEIASPLAWDTVEIRTSAMASHQTSVLPHAHADLLTDAAYDYYGLRLATCGLDQKWVGSSKQFTLLTKPIYFSIP